MAVIRRPLLLLLVIFSLICFVFRKKTEKQIVEGSKLSHISAPLRSALTTHNDCLHNHFRRSSNHKIWIGLEKIIKKCLPTSSLKKIKIDEYKNYEEYKFHVMPVGGQETVVSIGIGGDINAEMGLKNDSEIHPAFYGADPIYFENDKLYSEIGVYYPFAIGGQSGIFEANVLFNSTYWTFPVVYMELPMFLRYFVFRNTIDTLWMDGEGAEFGMMEMLHRGMELDNYKLTICQIHMEVHAPHKEKEKIFRNFLERIIEERRYVMLKATGEIDLRLFLVNVDNSDCLNRFVNRFLEPNYKTEE